MGSGKELYHFLESLESLRNKKTEFLNAAQNSPVNFVLCTHVLPDGIGDLVHLKDFADYLEAIPNTNITRVAFVLDSDMNKAASILEIGQSKNYYIIPYKFAENGELVLTNKGQDTLTLLQQKGLLEHADYRVQISARLQIKEKNSFLDAKGVFTEQDWLSFLEIRPGVIAQQTKPYAQGLVYMGLDKNNKEAGIKLNATISQLSERLASETIIKKDIVEHYIKNPLIKKTVTQALNQDYFIATGYLHTHLSKQAYLTWLSHVSEQKNILITSNKLNSAILNDMDLSSLSAAGIGQIVFHNSDGSESVSKIGDGPRQIDILQMIDCSNEEIDALFALAHTTCAAGDTSIGQVMSSLALPFFDVVDNKRYFFDTQFLQFIQQLSNHQPLYDYLDACIHLVTEDGINQAMLQKMIEITKESQTTLLSQWQQITTKIYQEYNAYDGLLQFIAENASYQFFALASQALFSDLNDDIEGTFLQQHQQDFFDYLIYTEKTELLSKLLEKRKFDPTVFLNIVNENNYKLLKLIPNAEKRFLDAILQNLDPLMQEKLLSMVFLYCAQNGSESQWIKDKFTHLVDCRSLNQFNIDSSMGIDEDYVIALCTKALADNDEDYFKTLPAETLHSLQQILPTHLVPLGIQNILQTGISAAYISDDYDSYAVETAETTEVSNANIDMRRSTLSILLNLPLSESDKEDLIAVLEKPSEDIYKEALEWLRGDLYELTIGNDVAKILTKYAYDRFEEQTVMNLLSFPISYEDKQELTLLIGQSAEEINKESFQWQKNTFYDKNLNQQIANSLHTLAKSCVKQQTINTFFNLPISDVDKQELVLLLEQPLNMIKKEAIAWTESSFYDQSIGGQVADALTNFAGVIKSKSMPLPKVYSEHKSLSFFSSNHSNEHPYSPNKAHVVKAIKNFSISVSDKEKLTQVLDASKESILAEADRWQTLPSIYEPGLEKQVAELLINYANQLEDNQMQQKIDA
ncbi:Uncharacterised protein [Legionella beliardensis]|uniref:Uncharacterized protein n=1 Tax=Legionella beliardensis TaxID=91822 RepID=A0A378JQS6_9GAMM|nr:hypothetical protein [Legionella beliardensis]STX55550.1 Uncharacterised protein [Legionella beliardensis]